MPQKKNMPRKANKRSQPRNSITNPPQIVRIVPDFIYKVRYVVASSGTAVNSLQPFQICSTWFASILVPTVAPTLSGTVETIKFKSLEAWVPSTSVGGTSSAPNTITVGFVENNNFGSNRYVSDTSMSVVPAHVKINAKKGETSDMWQGSGGNQPWTLDTTSLNVAGAVIDITCQVRLNCAPRATASNSTLTLSGSPIKSVLYFTAMLESGGSITTNWIPVGVNLIA